MLTAETDTQIKLNTFYYPGWKVYVNNIDTPIQFQDSNNRGLITFHVPQGHHQIKAIFTETRFRLLANLISLFSLLLFVSVISYSIFITHE